MGIKVNLNNKYSKANQVTMDATLVIGTRPQIIKTAPLILEAEKNKKINIQIIHTGQHYDFEMSKLFFNELSIPEPIINLGVGSGSHGIQTARMLLKLEESFKELKPEIVIVPGDTNSTLAGALAAVKMHIPVTHIESGARSFDMNMPEEVNRRLTDHCSSILFTVSKNCRNRLIQEAIPENTIHLVGDTMYDSIINHRHDIEKNKIDKQLNLEDEYFVLTTHRAENVDNSERLKNIFNTILELKNPIIFPCHPRTKKRLVESGLMDRLVDSKHITLLEPIGYYSILKLIKNAKIVLTDSGGIQKEAFWLDTPCITLRDNTEWIETIEQGMNTLTGSDPEKIKKSIEKYLLEKPQKYENPYYFNGASKNIIQILKS